jgi:hypothetical protein
MNIHSEFSAYTTGQSTYETKLRVHGFCRKKLIAESGQEREQLIIGEVINFRLNHKAFYERTQLSFTPSQSERLFESALQC